LIWTVPVPHLHIVSLRIFHVFLWIRIYLRVWVKGQTCILDFHVADTRAVYLVEGIVMVGSLCQPEPLFVLDLKHGSVNSMIQAPRE
jgi:hypothetical protein